MFRCLELSDVNGKYYDYQLVDDDFSCKVSIPRGTNLTFQDVLVPLIIAYSGRKLNIAKNIAAYYIWNFNGRNYSYNKMHSYVTDMLGHCLWLEAYHPEFQYRKKHFPCVKRNFETKIMELE